MGNEKKRNIKDPIEQNYARYYVVAIAQVNAESFVIKYFIDASHSLSLLIQK